MVHRIVGLFIGIGAAATAGPVLAAPAVDFNREVRPILSENCFSCHGPDHQARKAELRLDVPEGISKEHKGKTPIVPGKADQSEVIRRIITSDHDELMPPPKSGKKLTPAQIETIRKWVEQGAKWERHWSFVPPVKPELPKPQAAAWARNPVDLFILANLEHEKLRPSPEADKSTLIRRLSFDLAGLPPTPAEVDAFLLDNRPDAYERLVDRLIASPHFGERMAVQWLDAARFADTNGYHIDTARDMTRWREWVINAYNNNKPFDQFTVEQLAGDMLPNSTIDQQIASGFNRNHMINFEGGAIPEEYHHAYLIDRVNTTGAVWLGLTVACAQCHDHKYDPFTAKDYYKLYAFFNNVPENGLDGRNGNAVPMLKLPTAEQKQKLETMATEIASLEGKLKGPLPNVDTAQDAWERELAAGAKSPWNTLTLAEETRSARGATLQKRDDQSIAAVGENAAQDTYALKLRPAMGRLAAVRLELLPDGALTAKGPGRSDNGNVVLTDFKVSLSGGEGSDSGAPLKLKSASADYSQKDFPVAAAIDGDSHSGWAIFPEVGKPHEAVFVLESPTELNGDSVLTVTLDFQSPYPQHTLGRFRVSAVDRAPAAGLDKLPDEVRQALAIDAATRTDAQREAVRRHFREKISPETQRLGKQLRDLKKEREKFDASVPSTMVMKELDKPRDTFVMMRGAYDQKGEKVTAGTPSFLPPPPAGAPANRLGLAEWLVDESHPLTSRVAVNRLWQMLFGVGLVKTSEDFGSQGELPINPQLLDYLAVRFMKGDDDGTGRWDVKAMVRLMVTSAAYRQASNVSPELVSHDPENRLLARGPRFRLQAEFIRDQALAVSGLLDGRIGGASVSPYQPAGLWEELMSRGDGEQFTAQTYEQSHGPDLYRRTMYTFWKRTCPPPTLSSFDAPDREVCTIRRAITNTPLQALILLNDPTYVESSRKLAERMMKEAGENPADRIAFAFRLATARPPTAAETDVLTRLFNDRLAAYRKDESLAKKLLSNGESPRDEKLKAPELAAWTMVASTILNLDETVTKG